MHIFFFLRIRRLGNFAAHKLTKHARHVRGLSMWMVNVPLHLHDVLLADNG